MATHSNRTLAFCLVVTLVTMWCVHAFSNTVIPLPAVETAQISVDMSDHGHSHEPLETHISFEFEHQHNGHTADHTHDSVQLTQEADQSPFELFATPQSRSIHLPTPPLYLITKPPWQLS